MTGDQGGEVYLFDLQLDVGRFRIGAEADGSLLTLLSYGDVLVVPFSSWKGAFKRISEVLARSYGEGAAKHHLDDEHKGYSDELIERVMGNLGVEPFDGRKLRAMRVPEIPELFSAFADTEYSEKEVREIVTELVASKKCPVDRLYGSKFFASELSFSDSIVRQELLDVVTHVTINRKTGTALKKEETGNLFSEEVVGPLSLSERVIFRAPNEEDKELWRSTLNFVVEEGIQIGSGKSRGLGSASLNVEKSSVRVVKGLGLVRLSLKDFLARS